MNKNSISPNSLSFLLFTLFCLHSNCSALTEVVRVGIILEDKVVDDELILSELEKIKESMPDNVRIEPRMIQTKERDPYEVVKSACVMLRSEFAIFLSISTCPANAALAGMAKDKRVAHLAVNYNCDLYDQVLDKGDYSFPLVIDSSQTVDVAIAQIVKAEKWTSFVVVHDKRVAFSRISAFVKSVKKQTKDLKHTIIEIDESTITNETQWTNLFDSKIRYIFEEDAKDYFNFIVFASFETTRNVINSAENVIEKRHIYSYNWIIGNQELTVEQMKQISTRSKIVALSRKQAGQRKSPEGQELLTLNQTSSFIFSSDNEDREDMREVEYLLDALWVVRDLIMTTSGQIDWRHAGQLQCSVSNTATFKDGDKLAAALKTVDINARSGSIKFIDDRLKVFIELGIWATSLEQESEGSSGFWELVGSWDIKNRMQLVENRTKPFKESYISVENLKLRIVTIVERPFIIRSEGPNGTVEYTGCCVDILNAIQKELRNKENGHTFQYEMYEVADNKYGIVDPNTKKWNGLIGDILQKKADMAVAGMIRNYERELVVDFTASYMDYGVSILISKPQKPNNVFGFLEPLTVQVWISICVATFLIGLLLFVLSQLSPFSRFNMHGSDEFSFKNAMWFALASLMQQGGDATPVTTSGRILGTFWWFFSLIIVATYTANLAAFLTVTRMETPIESLEDLANQKKIRYGTVADSSLQYFFRDQAEKDQLYERIWTYMSETQPAPMVKDEEEGLHLVLNGDYAFLWDDPVLQFHRKQNCHKLQVVGKPFNKKNYAFAVPKGAPYWETITLSILRLQESGELDKIKQKWFESSTTCTEEEKSASTKSAEGIELDNVAGVFYILGAGALISLLTCVIEYVWFKYLSDSPENKPLPSGDPDFRDNAQNEVCDCLDGEVILNKSANIANNQLVNGGIRSRLKVTKSLGMNNLNERTVIGSSQEVGGRVAAEQRKHSITPENNPPYLDYLPLKTVSRAVNVTDRQQHNSVS